MYIKEQVKNRDRFCLYSIILLFVQAILMIYSVNVIEEIFNIFINAKLGSNVLKVSYNLITFTI